ncbi:protein of unknown function [Pedobacter westerhofensis]|uniref:DUF4861 domain-containing protein n=1 Tax=Pedobacter westerhofensis TaxID=425512 RepID=A0A521D269_9SPHI|nr:DUF4861 family protein [Pedobacter westerhofensis]SMO65793.1 protein of unknown function [Pedobacter westerhofensis]
MKKVLFLLFIGCGSVNGYAQQVAIQLRNMLPMERKNELIELDRAFLEKKLGRLSETVPLEVVGLKDRPAVQFDDLNGDGKWEKAVFLCDFKSRETVKLKLVLTGEVVVSGGPLAHVRHRRKRGDDFGRDLRLDSVPAGQPNTDFTKVKLPPFLTEGPAWENDKVGFRIYMDVRNTKDIWGKTTPAMMMDVVGVDPNVIYHDLAPWGMDILAVGKSLGAGSLALSVPVKGKSDTLVRLGGINMGRIIYKKISDGPVRAVFQMQYPAWNVLGNGRLTSLTEQISIWGGQYFYESKVSMKNAPAGAKLVTGIVNLKSKKAVQDTLHNPALLYTFDRQSENKDNLGMAVMLNRADLVAFGQTPDAGSDVLNTYTVQLKMPISKPGVTFRFYSCWERSDANFASEGRFKRYLSKEAKAYTSPILVK